METRPRRRLNPHLGVEIDCAGVDLTQPLTRVGVQSIFDDIMTHKVVALRNTGLLTALHHQELLRQVQKISLEGTDVEKPDELAFEPDNRGERLSPFGGIREGRKTSPTPGVSPVGPWPTEKGAIGNAVFHADFEFWHHGAWFTSLRMAKIPREPETGEIIPCGDTMWADLSTAWDDLPADEKAHLESLRCVYDWKVAVPHVKLRMEQGVAGYKERYAALNRLYPPVERPLVRTHPITKRKFIMGSPGYASHIVGMSREESLLLLRKVMRLCEVPEYQLRLPWKDEGDVVIFDNYGLHHRVVADFYHIPPRSRLLENIATKGYPSAQDVLVPGVEVDEDRAVHHEVQKQTQTTWSSSEYLKGGSGGQEDAAAKKQAARL